MRRVPTLVFGALALALALDATAMAQGPRLDALADAALVEDAALNEHAANIGDELRWEALRELRLEHHAERRLEGWLLTGWGILSAVGGVVVSVAGRNESLWLSYGLTTLSFAAFNIPLGIGLLDIRGSRLQDIHTNRHGDLLLYDEVLEAAISAQTSKRTVLAVNGALDVLYMLGGALLVGLASRTRSENTAAGAGWAMVGQGAVLLGLDIYGIITTSRRARELRALRQ